MITHDPLEHLRNLDKTSPQFSGQLSDFLRGNVYRDVFPSLNRQDVAWLVEYLDDVLTNLSDHTVPIFQESLRELSKVCGIGEIIPKSCTLRESLLGCVFEGTFDGSKVRVRRVRTWPGGDIQKLKEIFHQVTVISKHLKHPNIVPVLGVTADPFEIISGWMPGGDLTGHIANNPSAERLSLLSDIAEGLNYLHSYDVIHGDLKGSNILVDATGHARITDFGLAMVVQGADSLRSSSIEHGHTPRWIAPEIFDGQGTHSKEADVFSFAGVAIEVFTGAIAFSDRGPREAMLTIAGGERPQRPTNPALKDGLWTLIQRCWSQDARLRPHALRISCSFSSAAWKRLTNNPPPLDERISLVTGIFSDYEETEVVRLFCGENSQHLVEVVDEVLDKLGAELRRKCLRTLCKICGREALLPRSVRIAPSYDRLDPPLCHGGFAEVWKGEYQGLDVAVKVLKVYTLSDLKKITRRFCKEVMTWKALHHPNLLPLLGVTMEGYRFEMVSEWMPNGNINEFLQINKNVNPCELLIDVAQGLIYMHREGIIHGDLKGANILVDNSGHARLADFGLVTIASDTTYSTTSYSSTNAGTTRWMSPELLDPDHFGLESSQPTKPSDCYALGMVILEVLSGQKPFTRYQNLTVMRRVMEGERPERPCGVWFTDDLWRTLELCWSPLPQERPPVDVILECLRQDELLSLLETTCLWKESSHMLDHLRGDNAQVIVDTLDEALDGHILPSDIRKKCIRSLYSICAHHSLFPASLRIELSDNPIDIPLHRGGFADVSKHDHHGREVAVKTLRVYATSKTQTVIRRFCKEFVTWKSLRHPNVLALVGVVMTETEFSMVSEWMPNGNLSRFVREHPRENRFTLLSDVANGLIYMHSQGVIHGDLKGSNVLIDQNQRARLADFGLAIISDTTASASATHPGTVRWASPELFNPTIENHSPTIYSDCYALGMVVYEVLSLDLPFYQYQNILIPGMVLQGHCPERPEGVKGVLLTDEVWGVVESCWAPEPRNRPDVNNVLRCLEKYSSWVPPCLDADAALTSLTQPGVEDLARGIIQQKAVATSYITSALAFLMKVVAWDKKPQDDIEQALISAFEASDYLDCINDLRGHNIDPLTYINNLDKITESLPIGSDLRKRCIRALRKTCGVYGILPTSYIFARTLEHPGRRPFGQGGFCDVYKLADANEPDLIFAVRAIRVSDQDLEKINKRFCKRVTIQRQMVHPNILSMEGVAPKVLELCVVSQWMDNGNVLSYVTRNQGVDRLELLIGITRGLGYLHDNEVVHGDLKSGDILVDSNGNPRIADFGLSSITRNLESFNASTPNNGYTIRYCAPELFSFDNVPKLENTEKKKSTYASDVYSFSMVIVELVTGKLPFYNYQDSSIMYMVSSGSRPQRPINFDAPGITPAVWRVAERCWHKKPMKRPRVEEALKDLEGISGPDSERTRKERFISLFR